MTVLPRLSLALAALCGGVLGARGADRIVQLQTPPNVAQDVLAMPLIAAPVDDAERKINAAVSRLDKKVKKAAADCRAEGGKDSSYGRNVLVPMKGPRFISYEITDNAFCGGAHPDVSTISIVYDLTTGAPVDWTVLLPTSFTGDLSLAPGIDGTKMVTLSGQTLYALFLRNYRPKTGKAKEDADDADCRAAVREAEDASTVPGMMVWPDAEAGGLAVHFDLPHAVAACADDVTIPLSALRTVEASPVLIDAITKAHEAAGRKQPTR